MNSLYFERFSSEGDADSISRNMYKSDTESYDSYDDEDEDDDYRDYDEEYDEEEQFLSDEGVTSKDQSTLSRIHKQSQSASKPTEGKPIDNNNHHLVPAEPIYKN
jgi:hypothetical protein